MKLLALLFALALPMRITKDTTLPPNGEYHQAIIIAGNNLTLDCNGSSFVGEGIGVGILIQNKSAITIRNCKVRNFDVGMYVVSGRNFAFERNDFSGNYVDDNYSIEDLKPIPHGGAILNGIQNARVQGNTSNRNVAGIQILNSSQVRVLQNITSRNRGWGIYLYGTTSSSIYTNTVEYNNRSCPQWGKDAGCGSAGIVLTQGSNRNSIGWNILSYDGDGIYQGNTPAAASNDNEMFNNTIAHSVANGIEATFSFRNFIHDNTFTDDNYGGWFGYSTQFRFENNKIRGAHVKSIQADNAQSSSYVGNTFDGADVLLQPWQGGSCAGNSINRNILLNGAEIVTTGCQ
ncbi:MAG: right-handed parallel beta-helix repeat-containing protein [Chloroflexota bacterium]|nr:right-handed parallel beta-helix repeat-containing protein [Chloroflexota bacterium]